MSLDSLEKSNTCTICEEEYTSPCLFRCFGEKKTTICGISIGKCGHLFHTHCIKAWQQQYICCPFECGNWKTEKEVIKYNNMELK